MDDQLVVGLIREVEKAKSSLLVHEAECHLLAKANAEAIAELKKATDGIAADVRALTARANTAAWSVNWKAWAMAGVLFAAVASALAWTAGQLYALEPLREAAAHSPTH